MQKDVSAVSGDPEPFTVTDLSMETADGLRERMRTDGYLFFRGLVDGAAVRSVRADILGACAAAGWLKPGSAQLEGLAAEGARYTEPEPDYMAVYEQVLHGQRFNLLALHPVLLAAMAKLFGETPLPHARNIARIIFPTNALHTTPPHQDYLHIQGTEETYTAWIPLGDCPRSLGSLVVMPGSHREGIRPVHRAHGAGGVGIETESLPYPWVGSDFREGDVLVFHSLTIHKALPNLSPDRIRLSADFRYQPLSQPVAPSSLEPHYARRTWEEIYASWPDSQGRWYWRDMPVRRAGEDPRVVEIRSAASSEPLQNRSEEIHT